MERYNSRLVFVDSASNVRGNGEAATFKINNIEDFTVNGIGKYLKATLSSFSMFKNWYNINETSGIFYALQGTTYTEIIIPKGDYDGFTAATGILNPLDAAIQGAIVLAGFTGALVTYDSLRRSFKVDMGAVGGWTNGTDDFRCFIHKTGTPPAGVSDAGFFNDSWMIIGGRPNKEVDGISFAKTALDYDSASGLYISPYSAQLSAVDELVIRSDFPSMNYQSAGYDRSTTAQSGLSSTDIFARLPLTKSIFDPQTGMIHFEDPNDLFSVLMTNTQLSGFSLYLTDSRGRFIQEMTSGQASVGDLSFRAAIRFDNLLIPLPPDSLVTSKERMYVYPQNIGRG